MTVINLKDARGLSKIESGLASIKVIALILFVIFGLLTITGIISLGPFKPIPIFQSVKSFMPKGFYGVLASMIMVLFSFTGTGIIGLAIADTVNLSPRPGKDIGCIKISFVF